MAWYYDVSDGKVVSDRLMSLEKFLANDLLPLANEGEQIRLLSGTVYDFDCKLSVIPIIKILGRFQGADIETGVGESFEFENLIHVMSEDNQPIDFLTSPLKSTDVFPISLKEFPCIIRMSEEDGNKEIQCFMPLFYDDSYESRFWWMNTLSQGLSAEKNDLYKLSAFSTIPSMSMSSVVD